MTPRKTLKQDNQAQTQRARNPKLTDDERYKRFLDAAKAVGASDDPDDFDRAFSQVVKPKSRPSRAVETIIRPYIDRHK